MNSRNIILVKILWVLGNLQVVLTEEDQNFRRKFSESNFLQETLGDTLGHLPDDFDEIYGATMFGNVTELPDVDMTNWTVGHRGMDKGNQTPWELPIYMQFNQGHMVAIVVYSILMFISAVGNITVLVTIIRFRMKARLNRVNLFLLHLAIADLLVTFLLMPLEIGWASTVSWRAGDAACRVMSFFRIFGLYLSGFLLVCISLDRYFAVLKPLALPEANKRGRCMLYAAWLGSTICSLPQAVIFHVERHPRAQWFEQCVTFNFFTSTGTELAYSVFGFFFLYGFPLAMIISCYSCILYEIFKINNLNRCAIPVYCSLITSFRVPL
ncbi:unnamed protein product [Allacma fusca]|uniref:G-protein coupled receptors family 1 profile domain-containing protein n=1 Tax=Allacma fusca TaxID=39272 RepID=A0A8J2PYA1_9HEXA|nr:unnamed protein product [Allacma fusca]